MARLELRGVSLAYPGGTDVLRGIDLEVADGEFLVLVGPSGCGKSTLLRVVAGLVEPTAGDVLLDGRRVNDLEPVARDVAMVFQNYALYPHMTVAKNLAFPLTLARRPRAEVAARVDEVAELLGIGELLARKPTQLSGGQMQRVAVGRALVRRPAVFLFDEPLSNLDAKLRDQMRGELRRLHDRLGITTVYVTHDQAEAMTMGQRICVLEAGRALQVGPPLEVFARPASRFVAGFIGSPPMNLVEGEVANGRFVAGGLESSAPVRAGATVLGIRPQDVVERPDAAVRGRVLDVEAVGTDLHVALDVGGARIVLRRPPDALARPGEELAIALPAGALHWFDRVSGARLEPE